MGLRAAAGIRRVADTVDLLRVAHLRVDMVVDLLRDLRVDSVLRAAHLQVDSADLLRALLRVAVTADLLRVDSARRVVDILRRLDRWFRVPAATSTQSCR